MAVSDFINNGGFGMGSFNRAKAAGYSDLDIYNFLGSWGGLVGDQVRSNMNTFNQQQAQAQQGLGLQSYNRALASGQTPQQFFDYARGSGLTIGGALQAEMDKYAASQAPQQKQISGDNSLTKNLRIASAGGITRQEAMKIAKKSGVSLQKVVKRMDAMNKNGQDVRLNAGAANAIYKQLTKQMNPYDRYNNVQALGTGNIARAIQGMIGTPGNPGAMIKGQLIGATPGVEGTGRMMGGTQIRKGGRPAVIKQAASATAPGGEYAYTPAEVTSTATDEPMPTNFEIPEATAESKFGPGGPGSALDGGATGFRSRKSRWRSAGKTSKGTANLKIMGQTGRSSGVNLAMN